MDQPFRIMLVEDSRTQAAHVTALLEHEGWSVKWVASGEEALDHIGSFVPDMILVDYHLPGILGDEVCRQVRMRIDTRVIAVMMLTADDDKEVESRGLESGADDFIRKTGDPESLILRVRTLLNRARSDLSILSPSGAHMHRSRLLAVDDSPTFLAHLKQEFRNEMFLFETAPNATEAIPLIEKNEYDCVLIDMVMPEVDGIELCRRIDALRRDGRVSLSIIVLTADDNKQGLTRALEAGADDFVGKSSDISVLKVRIRASLRRRFYEQENQRILAELKDKQLEAQRARIESEAANARAAMADELRRSNAELKRFAHVGHHQLRQPLRTIASYCQLIQTKYGSKIDPQADRFMSAAVGAVDQMRMLLDGLVKYSDMVATEPHCEPVDLTSVVQEVCHAMRGKVQQAGATVHHDALPTIVGDRRQLIHLFEELIDNAIKFRSEADPSITIDATNHPDGNWDIAVRDNGIGIDPERIEDVFEVFGRLHTNKQYPGVGIGLSLCRRIAESCGGRIRIESHAGDGTTVIVDMPKHPAADVAHAA